VRSRAKTSSSGDLKSEGVPPHLPFQSHSQATLALAASLGHTLRLLLMIKSMPPSDHAAIPCLSCCFAWVAGRRRAWKTNLLLIAQAVLFITLIFAVDRAGKRAAWHAMPHLLPDLLLPLHLYCMPNSQVHVPAWLLPNSCAVH
jgi:hypothetical protein